MTTGSRVDKPYVNAVPPGLATCADLTLHADGRPVWVEDLSKACPADAPRWFAANAADNLAVSIAAWPCDGPVHLTLTLRRPVPGLTVRPKHVGVAVSGQGCEWTLSLPGPCHLLVEIPSLPPLLVFADRPEVGPVPDPATTRVFGPGEHDAGLITLRDGDRIYLAPGAVVYGGLRGRPRGATVYGRGILDGSRLNASLVSLTGAREVLIEGIMLRCGRAWQNTLTNCDDVTYRDVKVLSFVPYGDGIDPVCSRNIRIENCFFRCSDDCIAVKGMRGGAKVSNVLVQGCVMAGYNFSDGFTVGFEADTESIERITVRDCDVLYARGANMVGQHSAFSIICDGPALVRDVTFEDIRIEENVAQMLELNVTSGQIYAKAPPGHIRGVRLRNVRWETTTPLLLRGFDAEHRVEDVVFEGCRTAGVPLSSEHINCNEFVAGIVVR